MDTSKELRWVQPHWKHRKYELKDGDQTVARLEYRGSWKTMTYIILDQEELMLRRRGVFRAAVLILRGEQEIARFEESGKNKKTLSFVTGRHFRWGRQGFWSSRYTFTAPDNAVLMTFKSVHRFLRSESVVQLHEPTSSRYPETRLLLAFGWYLMLASAQAAATAAAAG